MDRRYEPRFSRTLSGGGEKNRRDNENNVWIVRVNERRPETVHCKPRAVLLLPVRLLCAL
jgi:hypothetical protein